MKVAFLHSDKPRERLLADAFLAGAGKHGHETQAVALGSEVIPGSFDVVAMVGVKSRDIFRAHHRAGAHIVYLDKGYSRHKIDGPTRGWEFWRVAIDAHQPTDRLLRRTFPADRWERLGLELKPWREDGAHIVIAGSSAKYHAFYGMKEPTSYARKLVRGLREFTEREMIYRPKPSWADAVPVDGTRFSRGGGINDVLEGAWAMVTHGSNACFESVLAGVPCIVVGDAVAKPLSSTSLADIEAPRLASESERLLWASALAYFQWTSAEFLSGEAWELIQEEIHA